MGVHEQSSQVRSAQVVIASAAGIGAAELAAVSTRSPGLVDRAAELALDLTPVPVIEWTIRNVGRWDKPLLRAGVASGLCAAGALASAFATTTRRRGVAAATIVAGQLMITRRRQMTPWPRLLPAAIAGAATQTALARRAHRFVVGVAAAATLDVTAAVATSRRRQQRHRSAGFTPVRRDQPADGAETWPGISPLITPASELFVTDTTSTVPAVDISRWRLAVDGLVGRPQTFTMTDLEQMDTVDCDAVLCCIHNRLDTGAVGNVRWTGVPLASVLEPARASQQATHAIWRSIDGWSAAMPVREAIERGGIVALAMNDEPLSPAHGFPARVFIPGVYGQFAGAKWLQAVELAAGPTTDYWTRKGWPAGTVPVRPQARIDHPSTDDITDRHCTVTGVAWAPPDGVATVEISVDDGPWRRTELADELSPTAWRRWRCTIDLAPGRHRLRARATSAGGVVQDSEPRVSFPTGVSGYHQLTIHAH